MKTIGKLNVYRYIAKNGTEYRMTFFKGKFCFVHLKDTNKFIKNSRLIRRTDGKTYMAYEGDFSISKKDIIYI